MCGGSEAEERKSERMDTAYSPRLHEEELSATASRILWGQPMATINQFFLLRPLRSLRLNIRVE